MALFVTVCHCLSLCVCHFQARLSRALHRASHAAVSLSFKADSAPLSNEPSTGDSGSAASLSSIYRRCLGQPFFMDVVGVTPAMNPVAEARHAREQRLPSLELCAPWTSSDKGVRSCAGFRRICRAHCTCLALAPCLQALTTAVKEQARVRRASAVDSTARLKPTT